MKYIVTADWHIRSDVPRCRLDDFQATQIKVLEEIRNVALKNKAIILHAGDIFDRARPDRSQELEMMIYDIFASVDVYFVAGNHDLLYHNVENFNKGSIGVVSRYNNWHYVKAHNITTDVFFFNYGEDITDDFEIERYRMCVLHKYVTDKKLPKFMTNGITTQELIDKYKYDVFITGDNHTGFIYKSNNKLVLNPGCITRQTADMIDYKPMVYLFDTETKNVDIVYLSDTDRSIICAAGDEEDILLSGKADAFIEMIKNSDGFDLDFEKNIDKYCVENNIKSSTLKKIQEALCH